MVLLKQLYLSRLQKRAKSQKLLIAALGVSISLTGCVINENGGNTGKNGENSDGAQMEAGVPEIDKFDSGMGKAHYISAPSFIVERGGGTESEGDDGAESAGDEESAISSSGTTDYQVSYKMTLDNTSACFVLGDKKGEYGELILCELTDHGTSNGGSGESTASFTLKRFYNGMWDQGTEFGTKELSFSADKDALNEENSEALSDLGNTYDVEITVKGKELTASINAETLGTWQIPGFELGCVGTYKSRGTSYAYIDDIVVSRDGKSLLQDDFDGHFENNLYEYNYSSEATCAFSPYYVKIVPKNSTVTNDTDQNNVLRVSSGFTLSETAAEPAPVFRREFLCESKELKKAYLYMTAFGSFDAGINGVPVSENFFDPGKMVYDRYTNYVSYDVTDLIKDRNTLDVTLFHGFFDRGTGYPEAVGSWGEKLAIKGELVLVYNDDSSEIIPTDSEFKVYTDSRYRFADIYHGEIIDDRYYVPSGDAENTGEQGEVSVQAEEAEQNLWQDVVLDDVEENYQYFAAEAKVNESIKAVETREYVEVTEPVEGHFVYDFGQNFAGTISFDLKEFGSDELKEGQVITFRYGELLNSDKMVNTDGETGTVWTQNLLTARATDYYVVGDRTGNAGSNNISGANLEQGTAVTFGHTYHGFRFLEITGLDRAISKENLKALVLSSGMEETGTFECSSDMINSFYNNSRYSMRSNLMDVPTDCAQRDERLGWTGDAQAASLFGMYQYDAKAFYDNYMLAILEQQGENAEFMDVAPFNSRFGGHNCWGDAPVVIAWNMYQQYGDKELLEKHYMRLPDYIDYLVETSDNYLRTSGGYGDHLAGQDTIETLSDTAWCANSARLVSKMAKALGKNEDFKKYRDIADSFTFAWQKAYIREDWSVEAGILLAEAESETAYSLGIAFDLFPEDIMEGAKDRLKILTEYGGYSFYPGYSGMAYYLPSLASGGHADTAVKVLENTAPGGIAYPITKGLTTNPEELMAFKAYDENGSSYDDGSFRVTGSLNHAAYSSVCSFFFTDILGIKPDEEKPGYGHFYIEPAVNCGLKYASGSYKCRFGTIMVSWNLEEQKLECEVPQGTTCTIILPGDSKTEVEAGNHSISWQQ